MIGFLLLDFLNLPDLCVWPSSFTKPVIFRETAMPNTNRPLPIQCPKCQHVGALLVAKSLTVMTATCATCHHFWATEFEWLPPDLQRKVTDTLRNS